MPDCLGCPVVAGVSKVHFSLHAELAGAASIRHSLRPPGFLEGRLTQHPGGSCRGNAEVCPLPVVIASEAKQSRPLPRRQSGLLRRYAPRNDDGAAARLSENRIGEGLVPP